MSLGDQLVSVPNVVKYLGANLASVHSSEEDQFLQTLVLVKTIGFPPTWIGGFYSVKVGSLTLQCYIEPLLQETPSHLAQVNSKPR